MSITIENTTNKVKFGDDTELHRKQAGVLETPGALEVGDGIKVIGEGKGITFPDGTTQLTAATEGGGGSPSLSKIFNNTARYRMVDTSGQTVHCVSTGTVFHGLAWTRTGTVLTIAHGGHGRSVGERAIVRNTNVDFQTGIITAADEDTFTINCANTGPTAGSAAAYLMGFTFAHTGAAPSITGATLQAPANYDAQLLSLRMYLAPNTRAASTFILVAPASITNGAGGNTSQDDLYVPVQMVRQSSTTLPAVGATIGVTFNGDGTISFNFAAVGAVTTGIHILMSF